VSAPRPPDFDARLRRVRLVTRAILAVGFVAAVGVYVLAGAQPDNPLNDQLTSKKYQHDLEVYGGKANVLAAEFRDWFAGLWYGRNLAFTIAVLAILAALVYRFFATPLPEEEELDGRDEEPPPRLGPRRL
jgi:hypothetical protein